jgi:hypothetical protein
VVSCSIRFVRSCRVIASASGRLAEAIRFISETKPRFESASRGDGDMQSSMIKRRSAESHVLFTLLAVLLAPAASVACPPADEWEWLERDLNRFWRSRVVLCYSEDSGARGSRGRVFADFDWLNGRDRQFGPGTAIGILAHEWGHAVFGATELQSDCLAGFAMRYLNVPYWQFANFLRQSAFEGAPNHGTGIERRNAVARGYSFVGNFSREKLLSRVCPRGRR